MFLRTRGAELQGRFGYDRACWHRLENRRLWPIPYFKGGAAFIDRRDKVSGQKKELPLSSKKKHTSIFEGVCPAPLVLKQLILSG